jgi:nucleotide-binding universal stress UspA family protein
MYKHILVPTDGSELSMKAARAAAKLAAKLKARVTSLYVIRPYKLPADGESYMFTSAYPAERYVKDMKAMADTALAKVAKAAGKVRCDTDTVFAEHPWEAIIKTARARGCDLIVMASHGRRGFEALLLGSETQKVLTHSKTPVLVCR